MGELYAMGNKDDELKEAELLIEERRYNQAIELLTEVMRDSPRYFDEAEKLLAKIREARELYNRTYHELLETLDIREGEELDEQEAYEIIRRLEELDAEPNSASIEAFAQARRSIIFTVNDQRFQQIMNQADTLLADQRYIEAIELYLSGFDLHRELFEEEEDFNSPQLLRQIDSRIETIQGLSESFRSLYPRLDSSLRDYSASAGDAPRRWDDFSQLFSELLDLWRQVVEQANSIDSIRLSIMDADTTDIPFLSTLRVLTRGRPASERPNGIAGAVERPLVAAMERLGSDALAWIEQEYQSSVLRFTQRFRPLETAPEQEETVVEDVPESGRVPAVEPEAGFETVIALAEQGGSLFERQIALHNRREELDMEHKVGPRARQSQASSLYYQAHGFAAEVYIDLAQELREMEGLEEIYGNLRKVESIQENRLELERNLSILQNQVQLVEEYREQYDGYAQSGVEVERAQGIVNELLRQLRVSLAEGRDFEGRMVDKIADIRYRSVRATLESSSESIDRASRLVEGVQEPLEEGGEPVLIRDPNGAIDLIREAENGLAAARETVSGVLEDLTGEKPYIRSQERIAERVEEGRIFLERFEALNTSIAEINAEAVELNRQADIALAEGDIRLGQAENELAAESFEAARERLEQAGEAYSASLLYREDPEVRRIIDEEIPEIGEEIIFQQNQLVVREVREMINRGRELFLQERFIEAEQVLSRAQSRWLLTHTEDNQEVVFWLNRVERALEATSGITIEEDDPLYPEMMQILNLAKEDFRRGVELFEQGDRQRALERFAAAEKKTEYIKEPFPNNQEAGALYLRILQYTQPDQFESIYRERFRTAANKLESQPEEAYRELQVLRQIDDDFPGLQDAIYKAEIATGIRQPPPDPEKLARARSLYAQAESIVNRDVRAQFPVALTYLNEAINLDPNYQEAMVLKDRLQAGQGGQISVVLSSSDQQQLRRAQDMYIDGRYYEAQAIVEQLWQNPENRSNPKLLDLRRRIESRL